MTRSRDNATNVAGDISGITAGTGISGGGTSGTVTVTNDMATTINAAGDLIYGTANDAYTRLAIGTARQTLLANSGATAPEWAASPQSLMTDTGDILYASAANTPAKLAIGTTSQVLTVASGIPSWATPSSGGMTLISETVASSNSSISFSSLGSYKQLFLMWSGIYHSTTGSTFGIRLNNDSSNIYEIAGFAATAGTAYPTGNLNTYWGPIQFAPFGTSNTSQTLRFSNQGTMLLDNYTSTTKYKFAVLNFGFRDASSTDAYVQYSANWPSTAAVTSIDIVRISGSATISNVTDTSIRLYGIS